MGDGTTGASRGRRTAFRVIAILLSVASIGFGLVTAILGIVDEAQEIHAFHNLTGAALLLFITAPAAVAAARDPDRAMRPLIHLAAVSVGALVAMALSALLDVFTLPFVALIGVMFALRVPRDPPFPAGRPSPVLLVLVLAGAVPLVMYALGNADLQRTDSSSEHAEFNHWVGTAFYGLAALLLGLLAALRPSAYRLSAWSAGIAVVVLGGGSLWLDGYASALDPAWAWAALGGGLLFLAAQEVERRRLSAAPAEAARPRGP